MNRTIHENDLYNLEECSNIVGLVTNLLAGQPEKSDLTLSREELLSFMFLIGNTIQATINAIKQQLSANSDDALKLSWLDWLTVIHVCTGKTTLGSQAPSDTSRKLLHHAKLDPDMERVFSAWTEALVNVGDLRGSSKAASTPHPLDQGRGTAESKHDALARYLSKTQQSVDECIVLGRQLQELKDSCAHGEFLPRLKSLGMPRDVASRFMKATRILGGKVLPADFKAGVATQGKLFELLALDDSQLEVFLHAGQLAALKVEDLADMTVKGLRAAVRSIRADEALPRNKVPAAIRKRERLATAPS